MEVDILIRTVGQVGPVAQGQPDSGLAVGIAFVCVGHPTEGRVVLFEQKTLKRNFSRKRIYN